MMPVLLRGGRWNRPRVTSKVEKLQRDELIRRSCCDGLTQKRYIIAKSRAAVTALAANGASIALYCEADSPSWCIVRSLRAAAIPCPAVAAIGGIIHSFL